MRTLVASPPIVTAWLAKWSAIGGTVAMISGRAYPWRIASAPDSDAIEEIALRAEFDASPWMERGVRVAILADLQMRVMRLLEQEPDSGPMLTAAAKQAGPAAAAIAWAERKRRRRTSGDTPVPQLAIAERSLCSFEDIEDV